MEQLFLIYLESILIGICSVSNLESVNKRINIVIIGEQISKKVKIYVRLRINKFFFNKALK